MAFLKAGRNETRDLLFMRGWPDGFGERASEREREKEREREREREVNVSASRLILRLKIIRGPTPVTTREESWGAYLRGTFDVGHQPPIFYSPRKLHGSLHVPWEFHVDRVLLFFFFFFFFPDVLSYLHSWEKHPASDTRRWYENGFFWEGVVERECNDYQW